MTLKDSILAFLVILAWGMNFVVIKIGLDDISPLFLACLRFLMVAFPAIFLIKRPQIPIKWLCIYGMTLCFGQFAFLFISIHLGMPAGLASLLLQSQVFFTLILGFILLKERLQLHHWVGLGVAVLGVGVLIHASKQGHAESVALLPLFLVFAGGFSWALGNISNKMILKKYVISPIQLVVWSALVPILPFLLSSYYFEGSAQIQHSLENFSLKDMGVVAYLSFIASIMGYGIWAYLLKRYPTYQVAPLTLLVPVVGLASAYLILHEELSMGQWLGAGIIVIGLGINILAEKCFAHLFKFSCR